MNENAQPSGPAALNAVSEKIHPTLFIALGGTGMKVNIRLRRRILNAIWGGNNQVQQIADFPLVQFVNFDLDAGEVTQDGKSIKTDVLAEQVAFTSEEKIIEPLNLSKYTHSMDELNRHREVAEWFPLTPDKIRALGIDPSKGAGQIRALSRLYFYDKYPVIRDKLRDKVNRLLANIGGHADKLKKLGLEIDPGKIRIVISGSAPAAPVPARSSTWVTWPRRSSRRTTLPARSTCSSSSPAASMPSTPSACRPTATRH